MVEHQPSKLIVRVRFPSPAPIGGIPERPKGADCKSAVADFDGSNPSPTTIFNCKTTSIFLYFIVVPLQDFLKENLKLVISGYRLQNNQKVF